MLVMKENYFFHSDLKVVLVLGVPVSLERFTFFLIGLIDLDDFPCSSFLSIFEKICMSKNVVLKNRANYKLMLLILKEKNYQ